MNDELLNEFTYCEISIMYNYYLQLERESRERYDTYFKTTPEEKIKDELSRYIKYIEEIDPKWVCVGEDFKVKEDGIEKLFVSLEGELEERHKLMLDLFRYARCARIALDMLFIKFVLNENKS